MSDQPTVERAELASLASSLDELTDRITKLAEDATPQSDDVSVELFEIERVLRQAARRLDRLVRGA